MSLKAGKSRSKNITILPALNFYRGEEWRCRERTLSLRFLRYYVSLSWEASL